MLEKNTMGRVSADIILANNRDVVNLADADNVLEHVKHVVVSGVVDNGARGRLVLPQRIVDELHLKVDGEVTVRFDDNRREKRQIVSNVWLELLGRHSVFNAVVEPAQGRCLDRGDCP